MKTLRIVLGLGLLAGAAAANAQSWTPGSEIVGQTVQVETNGVTNTVTFNGDGSATIYTPSGRAIPATWSAAGGQLCLNSGGAQECYPYAQAFQANQPLLLTSNCNATSRWLASAVNSPPPPMPEETVSPERG